MSELIITKELKQFLYPRLKEYYAGVGLTTYINIHRNSIFRSVLIDWCMIETITNNTKCDIGEFKGVSAYTYQYIGNELNYQFLFYISKKMPPWYSWFELENFECTHLHY